MAVVDPALVAAIADALTRGQYPGFGAAQNDSTEHDDNVDATHPLNIKYLVPGNTQRIIAARLSFSLGAYRTYTSAANNPAVTSGASSASSSAAGTNHSHTVSSATTATDDNHYHAITAAGATAGGINLQVHANDGFLYTSDGSTDTFYTNGSPDTHATHSHSISAQTTANEASHTHGITHTHSVTSNVTLTNGVIEDTTATGVTIAFDGVDKTSVLGGPFNADQVELDVLPYIQQRSDKKWHTIALTPSGNGRIYAKLRLSLFVNAGINA
jgi:hypothetical protein